MTRLTTTTLCLLSLLTGCAKYTVTNAPPTNQQQADQLARSVAMASGGEVWDRVRSVSYTFVVRDGDRVTTSRTHVWDVKGNTDTVTVSDKPVTVDVRNGKSESPAEADALAAHTDDTYWLMAPLQLFAPGVTRTYEGRREVRGKEYEVLGLSFKGSDATPGPSYTLYVDPYTSLVAYWDYAPTPSDPPALATWEQYRHPAGLKLATLHKTAGKTIAIENLSVTSE